jgi:pyrimidine-nucleoside phosphorylase
MKDIESARELARTMVAIGERAGRRVVALLTQMEEPLGRAVGNALEVREAIQTLRGQGPPDLTELCLAIGAEMLVVAGRAKTVDDARSELRAALADGRALEKFKSFIAAQGGDPRVADDLSLLPKAPVVRTYNAPMDGVVRRLQAEQAGLIAMRLGAGRARRDDEIDPAVGLVFLRKTGQQVVRGEPLVEVHAATEAAADEALRALAECIDVGEGDPFEPPLILGTVRAGTAAAIAGEDELVAQAQAARERAYVPYSGFAVGAALRLRDGTIVTGANIENASYGLTNCAERTALFKAVFDHGRPAALGGSGMPRALGATSGAAEAGRRTLPDIEAVAVIADSNGPVAPCGACRQVLAEFCRPETPVVLADLSGRRLRTTVGALLPHAFGSEHMGRNDNHAQIPE